MKNEQVQLFEQMLSVFSQEDIVELCFRMTIEYDDLNGNNRRGKTISLIESCQQSDRVAELIELCQKLRPAASWPTVAEVLSNQSASRTGIAQTLNEAAQSDKPITTRLERPIIKIPKWGWVVVGLLLMLVALAVWRPWARVGEGTGPPLSNTNNTVDLNQTVSGKLTGSGAETWTYTGLRDQVDIRVEGGPDDAFVLILTYRDGGQAAYVDYFGRGEGELLKYYDLQEGMRIMVDESDGDDAQYTLSITASDWKYLWPGESYGGDLHGSNPDKFLYGGEPVLVDIILEMTDAEQPLLEVYKPDGRLFISTDQVDENGLLTLTNLELFEEDQYEIIVRDQASNGAVYRLEMKESDGG